MNNINDSVHFCKLHTLLDLLAIGETVHGTTSAVEVHAFSPQTKSWVNIGDLPMSFLWCMFFKTSSDRRVPPAGSWNGPMFVKWSSNIACKSKL